MKLPLRTITILVCTAVAAVFLYQVYWLCKLYQTRKQEITDYIIESLRITDYNEMVIRIANMSESGSKHGEISYATGYKLNGDSQFVSAGTVTTIREKGHDAIILKDENLTDTITIQRNTQKGKRHMHINVHSYPTEEKPQNKALISGGEGLFGSIAEDKKSANDLTLMMQQGIHDGIDLFMEPDAEVFDSMLTIRLMRHHINIPHRLEQLHFYMQTSDSPDTITIDTLKVISTSHYTPSSKAIHYDYQYTTSQHSIYRLWTEPVDTSVLKSLKGIIAISIFNIFILIFTFWYLIHTLLKQKSLDEMKTDFTHNITHELKTPISVAYAANDALLNFKKWEDSKAREKYLKVAQHQLKRLESMVEQILALSADSSKIYTLNKETAIIKDIVESVIDTHRQKSMSPMTISAVSIPATMTVCADRNQLAQMLSTLLDNAIKYSPQEVSILFNAQSTTDGTVSISIQDHGTGISPEHQKHIFEKFYRVPNGNLHNVKGYGLGLYYVSTMMRLHGGTVSVLSSPGKGSTFTLKFPPAPNSNQFRTPLCFIGTMTTLISVIP